MKLTDTQLVLLSAASQREDRGVEVGSNLKDMVGLGKVVISRRERIVMLEPFDKGLMATTLRYAYEVRDANDGISSKYEAAR
jgi:hypothetical protein